MLLSKLPFPLLNIIYSKLYDKLTKIAFAHVCKIQSYIECPCKFCTLDRDLLQKELEYYLIKDKINTLYNLKNILK